MTIDKEVRIKQIEKHFGEIMKLLGLNLKNASLKETPKRVAKMYMNELCEGIIGEMQIGRAHV